MASEEEWRRIAHQRRLGEQGSQTGNIHNAAGYQDYLSKQQRQREQDAAFQQAMGGQGTTFGNAPRSVQGGYRQPGQPMSPQAAIVLLSLAMGAGFGLFTESWVLGGGAFALSLVVLIALRTFFTSELGHMILWAFSSLVTLAFMVGGVYFVWHAIGPEPAMWLGGGLLALVGFAVLRFAYDMFASTKTGLVFHRRLVFAFRTLLGLGLISAAIYVYLNW